MWSPCTSTEWRAPGRRVLALALALLAPGFARAAPLEKLLMPGELTSAHAKLEQDCKQCHESFSRGDQARLCRTCHDKVDRDIANKRGFHGTSPQASTHDCHDCHSEHKGRDADIVGLKPALFDHRQTDFALQGAHRVLECSACHARDKPHREAASACNACHKKDDVHRGQMGAQCQDCHSAEGWGASGFNHDKTKFPLRDRHKEADCAACHPDRKYQGTTTSCAGCHRLQDPHGGLFGAQCGSCHGAKAWDLARFDHGAKTRFPLAGRHRTVECHACHTEKTRGKALPQDCASCHRASDIHQGRFGADCASCHTAETWKKKSFDHDRGTGFPLRGAHRSVACNACHATVPAAKGAATAARGCADCHGARDPHRGQLGARCGTCHDESSWTRQVKFDHELTRFPLLGLHTTVGCPECHAAGTHKSTPTDCASCHRDDDPHEGAFGPQCERCHAATGWRGATFDHDRQTRFPLDRGHAGLACKDCHRRAAATARLDTGCNACHAADDAHGGRFGADCARCHDTASFRNTAIPRRGTR